MKDLRHTEERMPLDDVPADPPPTYQESQESLTDSMLSDDKISQGESPSWTNNSNYQKVEEATGSSSRQTVVVRPSKPLVLLTPDPRAVRCRCGRKNDTTKASSGLQAGSVRCPCSYVVAGDGSSRYQPSVVVCPGNGCGRRMDWPGNPSTRSCKCGQRFSVKGIPLILRFDQLDETGVRCPCGELNDTSRRCRVVHKDICCYEYWLPAGTVRCNCGRIVSKDGTVAHGHPTGCCRRG